MMPPLHRHSRRFITALCAAWAAWTTLAPLQAAPPPPQLTALLFYATDGDGSEAPEKMPDTSGEIKRYEKALRQATTARHFHLIGKHTAEAQARFSIWLKPSPQFPLQLENTGTMPDGAITLYWILWQKETLPIKDRELVKSTTILTPKTPLIIVGPQWRNGRLIFLVRKES